MKATLHKVFAPTLAASVLLLSACAQPNQNVGAYTVGGAVVGGTAGAIIGREINNDNADMIGAISGAVIGGAVGNTMDRQRRLENQARGGYPY